MTEEINIPVSVDPAIQEARRVAFLISTAEHRMGIDNQDLPLSARLENILQGAMDDPAAIDPALFGLIHMLASAPNGVRTNRAS
ncbi:hypothetical protein [Bradyrhizobium ottawaense]|uniref:hypothetical protein n=1 Tax=Bradyrhizobium ottawaense TaxID=931866 RepID=UPI001BA7FB3D|nr:hypothetical protein [Bradyrhizobium ottawaense]MBR1362941.1 hypothetical protein [Bradyrhizobium ottawaense]